MTIRSEKSVQETCTVHGGPARPLTAVEVLGHWDYLNPFRVIEKNFGDSAEHCDFCHRFRPTAADLFHRPTVCTCVEEPCREIDGSVICVDCMAVAVSRNEGEAS